MLRLVLCTREHYYAYIQNSRWVSIQHEHSCSEFTAQQTCCSIDWVCWLWVWLRLTGIWGPGKSWSCSYCIHLRNTGSRSGRCVSEICDCEIIWSQVTRCMHVGQHAVWTVSNANNINVNSCEWRWVCEEYMVNRAWHTRGSFCKGTLQWWYFNTPVCSWHCWASRCSWQAWCDSNIRWDESRRFRQTNNWT